MELAEILALITAIALIATLFVLIWYTIETVGLRRAAEKQTEKLEESLKLTRLVVGIEVDRREEEVRDSVPRFEARPGWNRHLDRDDTLHPLLLTNKGGHLHDWTVGLLNIEDADVTWTIKQKSGKFWRNGDDVGFELQPIKEDRNLPTILKFSLKYGQQGKQKVLHYQVIEAIVTHL